MLNVFYCVLFSSRAGVRIRIRFSVWLISGYAGAHVFILLSVVIVVSVLMSPEKADKHDRLHEVAKSRYLHDSLPQGVRQTRTSILSIATTQPPLIPFPLPSLPSPLPFSNGVWGYHPGKILKFNALVLP